MNELAVIASFIDPVLGNAITTTLEDAEYDVLLAVRSLVDAAIEVLDLEGAAQS